MKARSNRYMASVTVLGVIAWWTGSAAAQSADTLTGPINTRGFAPGGAGGNVESTNPVSGTLGLTIPLAQLPPGPGGFTAGVSLVYNSNIYDIQNIVIGPTVLYAPWVASTHGGGWSYGYNYTLWSQPRASNLLNGFLGGVQCSTFPQYEQIDWYKTYLMTPDGGNHVLQLVSAFNSDGTTASITTQNSSDAGTDYYAYDFAGNNSGCKTPSSFSGILVYATIDSTYIRVEANTSNSSSPFAPSTPSHSWTAYFPDGSKASGPIVAPHNVATDSDATSFTDRNSNAVTFAGDCLIGTSCFENITDLQGRQIQIQYGNQSSQGWTDTITWPGVNGLLSTYVNWQDNSPTVTTSYPCMETIGPGQTQPNISTCSTLPTSVVVNSVQLPAATNGGNAVIYSFGYGPQSGEQSSGELHSLLKCVDASVVGNLGAQQIGAICTDNSAQYNVQYSYSYDESFAVERWFGVPLNALARRTLNYSQTVNGSSTQIAELTKYAPVTAVSPYAPPGGVSTVTQPNGVITGYYTSNPCPGTTVNTPDYCAPLLSKVVIGSGLPNPTTTELAWLPGVTPSGFSTAGMMNPYISARVGYANGVATETLFNQDVNGNNTYVGELDWFSASLIPRGNSQAFTGGEPNFPLRTKTSTPSTASAYWNTGNTFLRGLSTVTLNSISTQGATTSVQQLTYTYDGKGNLKNLQVQDLAKGGPTINTGWTYETNGNLSTLNDANQNETRINYDSAGLYPTSEVVSGLRTFNYTFDPGSGTLLNQSDDNGVTTTYTYDNLGRQTKAVQVGADGARTTSTVIDDVGLSVAVTQDLTAAQTATLTTYYDALGRVRSTLDSGGNQTDRAYQYGTNTSFVSYELLSNPYCGQNCTTDSQTRGWVLTTRDYMGRPSKTQYYPGATPPQPWSTSSPVSTGTVTVDYDQTTNMNCSGLGVQTTDEVLNKTTQCPDGLGRLAAVVQPDGSVANYTYDVLDDLLTVKFGGQYRRYEYDALRRLTAACNPESVPDGSNPPAGAVSCQNGPLPSGGVDRYTYDANSNLITHTNARGVVTTLSGYDGLNRPSSRSYSDGTQTVTYTYDQGVKGVLSSIATGSNATVYQYDGFSRIISNTQTTSGVTYPPLRYSYYASDALKSITYPSGRVVSYSLDTVGRTASMTGQLLSTSTPYVSSLTYTAPGGWSTMTLGTGVAPSYTWNDRSQLVSINSGNTLALSYNYCANGQSPPCSGNNGNLQRETITVGGAVQATQDYRYDGVGRLTVAAETAGSSGLATPDCTVSGAVWCQHFAYDVPGNMHVDLHYGDNGSGSTMWDVSNFDSVTNRIQQGKWHYDDTGNVTKDGMGDVMTYDAENRQTAFCPSGGICVTYQYDGEGQRVAKVYPGGSQMVFVYDAFGNIAAEYTTAASAATGTQYLMTDQLGSTRLVLGNTTERHDYLPFGNEYTPSPGGWRSSVAGYGTETVRQMFAGDERDNEGYLDFLQARYLSSVQGRFMSPDPGNVGANANAPQTWNGYAYVSNNPRNYTDPNGEGIFGDFGAFLGSLFPGLGTLIGWGIGSIADLATGQSISAPGFDIGGAIVGSIAGSVTGGSGTLFGGGSMGGSVFSFQQAASSVKDVGPWEGLIPIWGSGWHAYYDFKRGCAVGGVLSTAVAISDVFLVKAAGESIAKGAWKVGSNAWGATRSWYGATRELDYGQHVHHWAIPRNGWGKSVPNALKNQPWNLMPLEPPPGYSYNQWHNAIEGKGPAAQGLFERLWNGTPGWFQNAASNVGGRITQLSNFIECR